MNFLIEESSYSKSIVPLGGMKGKSIGNLVGADAVGNLVSAGQRPMVSLSLSILVGMNHVLFNLGFNNRMVLLTVLLNNLVWAGISAVSLASNLLGVITARVLKRALIFSSSVGSDVNSSSSVP